MAGVVASPPWLRAECGGRVLGNARHPDLGGVLTRREFDEGCRCLQFGNDRQQNLAEKAALGRKGVNSAGEPFGNSPKSSTPAGTDATVGNDPADDGRA